ncbi:MAG TPA: ImmA/IrrE family metallo-endopeptidase [Caulobacteraceae bacterium]|jgi:Zn-dependent peptidase ImmA (M78 family)|nr:ImmA/IrrE family metallo-endopeptidase [Caulobacteraceae bacterium]
MSDAVFGAVFGAESKGDTPEERAQTSGTRFVRSQHQLSIWSPGASGRWLSAREALRTFGWEVLRELASRSATPLVRSNAEPTQTVLAQIDALGLDQKKAFDTVALSKDEVVALKSGRQVPFRKLERLAQNLSLEPDRLGIEAQAGADTRLGFRLRSMGATEAKLSAAAVLALAEAAWVIRKQLELSQRLGETNELGGFVPDGDYGGSLTPAWRAGFRLANATRELLGIGHSEPIESMTRLLEERLGVPVIHVELPTSFAGATIANGEARGIVVNFHGKNEHVWVRRMTMAHELGHFLWDPSERLNRLVVDSYGEIEADFQTRNDPVEQRANAFAVEFLAPREELGDVFLKARNQLEAVETVMQRFGIGRAASVYHLQNLLHGVAIKPGHIAIEPDQSLMGREEISVSLFKPADVPISRRGRFAVLVGRAFNRSLISEDTAGALLGCPPAQTAQALDWIASIDS